MRALSIAATGMQSQQTNVEVIANNLANMNTAGFKAERAQFEDLLYQNVVQPGSSTSDSGTLVPAGVQLGAGVRTSSVYRLNMQGDLSQTSNPYDLAISGEGFFKVTMPDGTDAYTRAGNFALSSTGTIVTSQGYTVAPGIAVPANALKVTINSQGQVQATVPGSSTPTSLGQLDLSRFPNVAGLNALGGNLYGETPASGSPQAGVPGSSGYGTIQQGYIETSNVNPVNEITALISAQRAYEMNSKVITAADEMMRTTSQLGGA